MRNITPVVLAGLALGVALAAGASADAPATRSGRTVLVHGSATVAARPDRVSFTAGVETLDASATAAYRANSAKVRALIAALKTRGVAEDQMQTSHVDMSTITGPGRPRKFSVSNLVTTTREDPSEVGHLIEAAVAAGANDIGDLNFFVADPLRLQQQGLQQALQNARAKAEIMAKQAGASLGDVVSMVDETVSVDEVDEHLRGQLRSLGYVGGNDIEPGRDRIHCTVTVVFQLR